MPKERDKIAQKILSVITASHEPLETVEIDAALKKYSRAQVFLRLHVLRGDGEIKGKQVGSGKQTWIWWKA